MTRYIDAGGALRRVLLVGLALGILMAATLTFAGLALAAGPPQEEDFFGTVMSVGPDSVVVSTDSGEVEVPTSAETEVRLPGHEDAQVGDLMAGDFVAVSMEEEDGVLVADTIQVIPGKTRFRHVAGLVVALTETEITVQPPAQGASPVILTYTSDTPVRVHKDTGGLGVGSFVVIIVARDPDTGELGSQARGINVIERPQGEEEPQEEGEEPGNRAEIKGPFQGMDEEGNWLVGGTPVAVDAATEIEGAVAAGQFVEVTAAVQPDGSFLALKIEPKEEDGTVAQVTHIEGVFQGQDAEGNWIINGTAVVVDERTDTDGMPQEGQRVEVKALLQEDGTLLAREIENEDVIEPEGGDDGATDVEIEGTFQGVDEDTGEWIINGTRVSVDRLTQLKGTPAVGSPLEVEALLQPDGTLVAVEVEGRDTPERESGRKAELSGVIDEVVTENGVTTLVVNGIPVSLSPLTEVEGDPQVGNRVELEAVILEDGSFRAREVEVKGLGTDQGQEEDTEGDEVEIEGTIGQVNDGSIVVNGITVVTSPLSEVKGQLVAGASVKVEGILQPDGTVLARELKGEGRRASQSGSEVEVEGTIDSVARDEDGNVTSIVVNGRTIQVEALTELEGELAVGARVEVEGVIADGAFLASEVQAEETEEAEEDAAEEEGQEEGDGEEAEPAAGGVHIEGPVQSLQTDDQGQVAGITVNGVEISVDASTQVEGALTEGAIVEISGTLDGDAIVAITIEVEEEESEEEAEADEFELAGIVEAVEKDDGNLVAITVDSQTIVIDPLTEVEGEVEEGTPVRVEGSIIDGSYVASEVEVQTEEGGEDQGAQEEGESNEGTEGADEQSDEGEQEQDESEGGEEHAEEGVTGS